MINISVSLTGTQVMRELVHDSEEFFYGIREELMNEAPTKMAANIAGETDASNLEEMATWFDSFATELRKQADG